METPLPLRYFKRFLDILFSLLFLTLLSPVFVYIFIAMLLEYGLFSKERGPFFYSEKRISHGREFSLIKFRILKNSVTKETEENPGKDLGYIKHLEKDPKNFTWIGGWLQKHYFDEIPQFINILRGDMSFVGPRPWSITHYRQYYSDPMVRIKGMIPCGLVGIAQSRKGADDDTVKPGESWDGKYLEAYCNFSALKLFWFDMEIIGKCMKVVFESKGL